MTTNPYELAVAESFTPPRKTNSLRFIWTWLVVAIAGSMLATPADIFVIRRALLFELPCFLVGVFWNARLSVIVRLVSVAFSLVVAAAVARTIWIPLPDVPVVAAFAVLYAAGSAVLGAAAMGDLVQARRRIMSTLSISYCLGAVLGPLGCLLLPVPAVLVVNRRSPVSTEPEGG